MLSRAMSKKEVQMKNLSGFEMIDTVDLRQMVRKPVDCIYLGSELIKNKKIQNGQAVRHTFAALQDRNTKFATWGFGSMDSFLCGNPEKDREPVAEGTPLRIVYKGKRATELEGGSFNVHDVSIFDITDEVEKKEITETKLSELVWA
jgi:hypothetical protein